MTNKYWAEQPFGFHSWVIVPASRLAGVEHILRDITKIAGGCTVTGCFGYWHDQDGAEVTEEVYRYEWYSNENIAKHINRAVEYLLMNGEKSVLTSNGLCYYEDTPN